MGRWNDPIEQLFGAGKVRMPSSFSACWPWVGSTLRGGYGKCTVDKRTMLAHRRSYELAIGPIPSGLTLDHLCRVRNCINPLHLEPVTLGENVMRSPKTAPHQRAGRTHCAQGHEYTPTNTGYRYTRGYPTPHRFCRECNRINAREFQRRKAV